MDVFIVLTGRKGHGKDTVADFAINDYKCDGKVGMADWFKEALAHEFNLPLDLFFNPELKDEPFSAPIIMKRKNIRNFLFKIGEYGFNNVNRISTMKWENRVFNTPRDMMLWFGHDFISLCCGEQFHCQVTDKLKIDKFPRKENHVNIFFVTDARKYMQSKYYLDHYDYVYPVKVVRPDGSDDDHAVEKSVDEFPEGYFFDVIDNDGTLDDLKKKVHKVLLKVKKNVTKKLKEVI